MGVFFWEYDRPIDFERYVLEHLIRQILPMIAPESTAGSPLNRLETPGTPETPGSPETQKMRKLLAPAVKGRSPKAEHPIVFLAYSHEDREKVKRLYEDLRIAGFHPWLDTENLLPGQMWQHEIYRAMKRSYAIVLCLSSNSISKRGYFQKEVKTSFELANTLQQGTSFVIPVRFDEVSTPPEISMLNYLDYFHPDGPSRLVETLRLLRKDRKAEQ